jgi:peptidase E
MTTRRIMATSGGFRRTDRWNVVEPGGTVLELLRLTGQDRPRLLLLATATGDDPVVVLRGLTAFRGMSVDVAHLELFMQPNVEPEEAIGTADAIWVEGGSVANLLAVWRVHGVDVLMRDAWERGVVLGGVSAGSLCWHVGGTTDSFGPTLRPMTNGLGLLPYGNGVHYDTEEQRRPLLHALVAEGTLPVSYATDNGIGILYEGIEPVAVVADDDVDPVAGPAAYRVERHADGTVLETRLAPGTTVQDHGKE